MTSVECGTTRRHNKTNVGCWGASLRVDSWLFPAALTMVLAASQATGDETKPVDFSRDIRAILTEKCLSCHSGEEPEGGLQLGDRTAVLRAGESGNVAVVPGKPSESELIRRIFSDDSDERMPPEDEEQLTPNEIEWLKRWIAGGAEWSVHWAFRPLEDLQPPSVKDENWLRNVIDRFTLSRLEERGFTPSSEADSHVLIKRLYYDLVGLPPSIEVVDAFINNATEEEYRKLVDQLLDSPHFGERWGRHWLDLAHFADSDGYEKDRARPDAHIYRDWVIEAFNNDMPVDQFTLEQLAGDLLPGATARQRIATGFFRQTLTNEEGGVDQEEYRVAACFDRTETVGTVWLGLTIGCVRCHEHKYDPLRHEEYYTLFAFFNEADEVTSRLTVAADDLDELERKLAPLEASLAARYAELAPLALEWETDQRERIMAQPEGPLKEHSLEIASAESSSARETLFRIKADQVFVETPPKVTRDADSAPEVTDTTPDKDVYTVVACVQETSITGFKLHVLPEESLPNKGPGRAPNGNFVLTGFQAFVVAEDRQDRCIELDRSKASYSQKNFSAGQVLRNNSEGRTGWAIGDKTGSAHWIQFRTREPITLGKGESLRFVLEQQYGGGHLMGKFRLTALTGDQRGLHLSDESIANALEMYPEKRVARTNQQLFEHFVSEVAADQQAAALRQEIDELQQRHNARLMDVRTIGKPRRPRTTHVFHRGDFLSPKAPIVPGVPAILSSFEPRHESGDRLDLAHWLVDRENFLTPRVAVNHVWLHLFGQGLVRTPNDFGTRGEAPTHPRLLDWLALRFHGDLRWSRKDLIRLIVMSSTYRQSSNFRPELEQQDPRNTMLFRQNRFRVESEIVRDLHLAVAGLLSPKIGGPSVFPPMPPDLAKLSYANNFTWTNSSNENRYRRGMYTFFKRTIPHPNLMTFDSPDANVACVARTVSNTPLQALTLLNNEVHTEAAQALAKRVVSDQQLAVDDQHASDTARLTDALRLCLGRKPTEQALKSLRRVLAESRSYYAHHKNEARQMIDLHAPKDTSVAEAAAWVTVTRVVLNMDEFIIRE